MTTKWEAMWRRALGVEKSLETIVEERRRLGMDAIKCLTCNNSKTEWTHGMFPDEGGRLAHEHYLQNSDHVIRVGEINSLVAQANALGTKGR